MTAAPLLLRKGRVLTPASRLRYRLHRVRAGKVAGFDGDDELGVGALVLRLASLPLLTVVDVATWPVLRRTLGRGSWWLVELRFHGPDAELVRIAEASTAEEARAKRTAIAERGAG